MLVEAPMDYPSLASRSAKHIPNTDKLTKLELKKKKKEPVICVREILMIMMITFLPK